VEAGGEEKKQTGEVINPDDLPFDPFSPSLSRADEFVEAAKEVPRSAPDVENSTPWLQEREKVLQSVCLAGEEGAKKSRG